MRVKQKARVVNIDKYLLIVKARHLGTFFDICGNQLFAISSTFLGPGISGVQSMCMSIAIVNLINDF